jgi:predicted O-methyltransferase YrrM
MFHGYFNPSRPPAVRNNDPTTLAVPNDVLREMYDTGRALTSDGRTIGLHSVVTAEFANALYALVKHERPEFALEVGLAHGTTALAIATALEENGSGRLVSIDPFQQTEWQGVGLAAIKRSGLGHLHTIIEEPDYLALPRLLEERDRMVDLAYIDGRHSYEYVLLDFFYLDRLLRSGGVVGFNDCDWPSVIPTLRFLRRHRHYTSVDVGLAPAYGTRNRLASMYLRVERKAVPSKARPSQSRVVGRMLGRRREDRYFRKADTWEPPEGWMPRGWSLRSS